MSRLKFVLADISRIEAGKDALRPGSHLVALFEMTLCRLWDEAAVLRSVELNRTAWHGVASEFAGRRRRVTASGAPGAL